MTDTPSENQASTRWGHRIGGAFLLVCIAAVATELAVRTEDWARWRTPFWSPAVGISDLAVRDELGMHPRPGARFNKWRINSAGTRGPELIDSLRGQRVMILGASETFGQAESPEHEYPRQVQDSLQALGCQVEVINGAFPGMSLPTVIQDLKLRLGQLQPRVVVYYPTPQQYLDEELPRPAETAPNAGGRGVARSFQSRFLARARTQVKGMLPLAIQDILRLREIRAARAGKGPDWQFDGVPAARLEAFDNDLRTLVGTVRAIGAVPVLVTHANAFLGPTPKPVKMLTSWVRFYPRASGEALVGIDSLAATRIARIASDSGLILVDAWQAAQGWNATEVFSDFSHFTDKGASRMAGLLGQPIARAIACTRADP